MKVKKRSIVLIVSALSIVIIALLCYSLQRAVAESEFFKQFQGFSVTINNQSDNDIVSVETGIIAGTSKAFHTKKIKSGETMKIKPELSLVGEGAIYMKYTDSKGDTKEETVCGYTESISGYSKVTISNDKVTVEQKCN